MKSVVSEKGQVTIPKPLRDRLGLTAGEELDFVEEQGRLVGTKLARRDPVAAVRGVLTSTGTTDEFVRDIRGDTDGLS